MLAPRWFFLTALMSTALAGCGSLPGSGPSRSDLEAKQPDNARQYILVEVDNRTLSLLQQEPPATLGDRFSDYRPPNRYVVGVGDSLTVTIWEAAAGGLFSSAATDALGTGARSAGIPEQQVAQDGSITVPYAGRVVVTGKTTSEIEAVIVKQLTGKAIQPQAVVVVTKALSNSATVLGEVTTGARVPLSPSGDRVLDVIASGGGIKAPTQEISVRLTRGNTTVTVPLQTILTRPKENVFVRPQDTITLLRQPQTFTVFGAAGSNSIVPFNAIGITLEEAIARAGGLVDSRADPQGIYLMRFEPARLAQSLSPGRSLPPNDGYVRVIYHWNMRDPNALFLARSFQMHDKDAIYVTNAPLAEFQKVTTLFNSVAQPVVTGVSVSSTAASGF